MGYPEEKSGPGERNSVEEKLRNEISRVESEMGSALESLKGELQGIKDSIVEMKAAISEMENPFNLVNAAIQGDIREGDIRSGQPGEGRSDDRLGSGGEVESETEAGGETEAKPEAKPEAEFQGGAGDRLPLPSFRVSISLIRWVWTLLDLGFDEKDITKLSRYCEFFGLLPRNSSNLIGEASSAVNKARSLGLSEEALALGFYGAARGSGLRLANEDLADILFKMLRRFTTPSEQRLLGTDDRSPE